MNLVSSIFGIVLFTCAILSCKQDKPESNSEIVKTTLSEKAFGTTPEGDVNLYTLSNDSGVSVSITNYGGIITSVLAPDKDGKLGDIVLGFDSIQGYLGPHPYFGAIVGRYGNRIANGQFKIGKDTYNLAKNNGPNSLHGGEKGFDKVIWSAEVLEDHTGQFLRLSYESKDMEEGFPGNLQVKVEYALDQENNLILHYKANTDKATHVNLTNHSYFNLDLEKDILGHELLLNCSKYTPVDETLIPTGELAEVEGTPFDFKTFHTIGSRIDATNEQINYGGGYDHNYVIDRPSLEQAIATVIGPKSGRTLKVFTEEPGVQLYTGNFLDGTQVGKGSTPYLKRSGFCLETQHFPNSPNQKGFPSTLLQAGEEYETTTIYQFGIKQ